jgi:S-adenosylhomocysteine hydrolase
MDFSNIDQLIPRNLPLLDKWVGDLQGKAPLKGVTILQIQHQLGNQFPQAKALLDLGLERTQMIWVDIPYTSIPEVRQALIEELEIPATSFHNHDFHVLDRYPPYQLRRIQEVFAKLLSDPPDRLVVLDDGAYFLEAASCFAKQLPAVAIVEQTTRGLIKIEESATLQKYKNRFPIVDVARSVPKQTLEPPFIGRAVCDSLFQHLEPYLDTSRPLQFLVLGFGAIGQQIAKFLPGKMDINRSQVHVYDPDTCRQRAALEAHFSRWDRNNFSQRFNLVIGCSGRQSFTLNDRIYLEDDAVLASASSGTVELSRQDFIELADESDIDDIKVSRKELDEFNVHSDLHIKLVDRSVTFVNGGFPVNFDGRVNCIPGHYIQPTPTMMVAAAVQAVKALNDRQKGIVKLDPAFCSWVDVAFRKELGDESSLLPPSDE